MRTIYTLIVFLFAVAPPAWASDTELKPSEVFAIDAPSIVVVDSFDKSGKALAQGSGVVIAKDTVVSNCHVIEKATSTSILYKQQRISAHLLYADEEHDLCAFTVKGLNALPVQMGSTSKVKVGDAAYAIGAPEGLELTLSGGLISSLRHIPGGVVLQMTTPISPGSSGGGLFDSQARLIGITSYYMTQGEQLNFALPIEWVNELPKRGKLAKANQHSITPTDNTSFESDVQRGYQAFRAGDYTKALEILQPLANKGVASAQLAIGFMYDNGQGLSQDYGQAADWYRKAAEQGNEQAQLNLGIDYSEGIGVTQDYTQAIEWYKKAAEQGNLQAQYNLGVKYENGQGVPQDYMQAVEWYRKAAVGGYAFAQYTLGVLYNNGQGVTRDYSQAAEWYRKAAEQGNAKAQYNLGIMYDVGMGLPQDYTQAAEWYRKAAEQGIAPAQFNLGIDYNAGIGVPQDYTKAVSWYRKSAEQGNAKAQYYLGLMYDLGRGVPQDYEQAADWYRKAAIKGYADAQVNLGVDYNTGIGVPQDYAQAVNWYRKSAEQGNAKAQCYLGMLYDAGNGVPQDYEQAADWYRKAAEQGFAQAQSNLGVLYEFGQAVPQNYIAAYALFNISASLDSTEDNKAAANRDKLINSMTAAQVEAGQALTREMQRAGVLKALDTYFNNDEQ